MNIIYDVGRDMVTFELSGEEMCRVGRPKSNDEWYAWFLNVGSGHSLGSVHGLIEAMAEERDRLVLQAIRSVKEEKPASKSKKEKR